jgi:Haem-binding domain
MRRFFGVVLAAAFLLFFLAQLYRPKIDHPPVTAEIQAPPEVRQILRNSCYNCHSNETRLSWFDQPAPAYWMVARDVRLARSRLNFSEIGKQPPAKQRAMLFEAVNMIQLGAMPLPSYRRVHREATVTAATITRCV